MKATTYALGVLNRRLDFVFQEMEIRWAVYQQDRRDDEKLGRYVASLRRANRLWSMIQRISAK